MKKIVITQRLALNESYYELREMLDVKWGELFNDLDFLPIVLPYDYDFKKYFTQLNIDGILLTGGNDLDFCNDNDLSKKRDFFENELVSYGIANKIPIFGICRGMQIIAKYFGSEFNLISNHVATKHKLVVNKDSTYFSFLNKLGEVNSYHNYAVKNVSDEILISSRSIDGIIKSLEHKEHKIFAQMWHSERENPFKKDELNLIKEFFNDK